MSATNDATRMLADWRQGRRQALDELLPLVYDELHRLAVRYLRRERPDHTLQPTALVHEAYLKIINQNSTSWQDRTHFVGLAAHLMRQILVSHAVRRRAAKRGGNGYKLALDEAATPSAAREVDLIALDEALAGLAAIDPQKCRLVELRYFGGLTIEETAEALGLSPRTVKREWRSAKVWLYNQLRIADCGLRNEKPGNQ